MTGLMRCPLCARVSIPIAEVVPGIVAIVDVRRRRIVCPNDGRDLVHLDTAEVALFVECRAAGHTLEDWRGSCECGTRKA